MDSNSHQDLLSSVVTDIKNYTGDDPLRPWLQGIRNIQRSLPPHLLKDKLPRFLQKCAQTFESDRHYTNDSRYLRVWIQLMDYVDDARAILRKMEKNGIGLKRAMFYSAYALYYEKRKKFEDAERMYHLGVQNLAEPAGELQKSYEQFLHRMVLLKKRKQAKSDRVKSTSNSIPTHPGNTRSTRNDKIAVGDASQVSCPNTNCRHQDAKHFNSIEGCSKIVKGVSNDCAGSTDMEIKRSVFDSNEVSSCNANVANLARSSSDDTVVVKFVGSAIVGRSEAEDACHHGLVDPTINMKEAMNAISCMFREPLDPDPTLKRSHRSKPKTNHQSSGFEVYVDESPEEGFDQKPFVGAFEILADDDDSDVDDECGVGVESKAHSKPNDQTSRSDYEPKDQASRRFYEPGLREDTVVRRFVGSTGLGSHEVENACHHGLVDPTINMKEAMDDINSMFGKPLDFVRARRTNKQRIVKDQKPPDTGFSILADDDSEREPKGKASSSISRRSGGDDLFEPTVFTKEAMADINEMFGKPLDF